jgi:uncharacterized membrane protein
VPATAVFKLRKVERTSKALLAILAICVLIALISLFHQQIYSQLNAWKLLPRPEKLTELYFTHPNDLPSTYAPGQSQAISFTVHNIEYQTMTYRYKIVETSQDGSRTKTIKTGNFTLQQNQYKSITKTVPLANLGARVKLTTALPTVHESIDYWLNRTGA